MIKTALLVLNIAAAFNGLLLSFVLIFLERLGPAQIRIALAGLIGGISLLLGIFVALDTGVMTYSMAIGVLTDAMALFAGALLFNYVCGVSGRSMTLWPFLPMVAYLLSIAIAGERYLAPDDIAPIIVMQTFFTIGAFAIYWRNRTILPAVMRQRKENQLLPALFAGIALLHGAQYLRLAFPGNNFFFDLVPFVGALGLILLVLYGVAGSQTLVRFGASTPPPKPSEALNDLKAALTTSKAHLDPDISLQKAASLVSLKPRELSVRINQDSGQTFRDFINALRIEEAKRLLASPAEAKTSIEAIGLLSGFRSRSSFYEAFKARVGMTPSQYRKSGDK